MNWYIQAWKKYAVFSGRAHRTEYWMFVLFNFLVSLVLGVVEGILGGITGTDQSILGVIYSLAVIIPAIALGFRRMHDIDRGGWWIFLPIVNLVFACTKGTEGENTYGPAPKL